MDGRSEWAWDRGDYDELGRRFIELAEQLVAAAERCAGGFDAQRVVDLACGTGNAALVAAGRGAVVTGVDLGPGLLEIARDHAAAQGVAVTWRVADATRTGLPAAGYDIVLSSVGLIFVPDRDTAVAEVARLLRPGGCFAYTAWAKDTDTPFYKPFERFLPDSDDEGPAPWEWAEPTIVATLLAAEFDDVQIERREYVWSFDDVDEAVRLIEASPMHVAALEHVDPADRAAVRVGFEEEFGALRGVDGNVTYTSPYVVVTARKRD